jgi:hypothetical protein
LQRKLEEVDHEAGKEQTDMPTAEMPLTEVQERFRPGYCITVHMSQGKTFRERFTIHDWSHARMHGRGRYVALSRGATTDQVQIARPSNEDWDGEDGEEWDGEDGEDDSEWDGEDGEDDSEWDGE